MGRFGGLWITNIPTAVSTTTVPTKLTAWKNAVDGPGVDADVAAGTVTVKVPGYYFGHCTISFNGSANRTFYAEFRSNGVAGPHIRGSVQGNAAGGRVNLTFAGVALLSEGDVISVYVYSDLAATMTVVDGQFGLLSI